MRVLIACEYSGAVRDAFRALGHDAMSCDLLPTDVPGPHYEGDVFDVIDDDWDLMVAHPPCTYLCNSGVRWLSTDITRWPHMIDAAVFFRRLLHAPIPRVAVENPIMHGHAAKIIGQRQTQVVQPWMFGHPEKKVRIAKAGAVFAIVAAKVPPMAGAIITLHYRVPDRRRRDADNLAATLKVCQDALVAAGVLVEDSWITVPASGQRIHPPIKGQPGALWLTLDDPDGGAS